MSEKQHEGIRDSRTEDEEHALFMSNMENIFCMHLDCRCLRFGWREAKKYFSKQLEEQNEI